MKVEVTKEYRQALRILERTDARANDLLSRWTRALNEFKRDEDPEMIRLSDGFYDFKDYSPVAVHLSLSARDVVGAYNSAKYQLNQLVIGINELRDRREKYVKRMFESIRFEIKYSKTDFEDRIEELMEELE